MGSWPTRSTCMPKEMVPLFGLLAHGGEHTVDVVVLKTVPHDITRAVRSRVQNSLRGEEQVRCATALYSSLRTVVAEHPDGQYHLRGLLCGVQRQSDRVRCRHHRTALHGSGNRDRLARIGVTFLDSQWSCIPGRRSIFRSSPCQMAACQRWCRSTNL